MTNSRVHSTMCKEVIAYTQQQAVAWAFMDLLLDTWDSVAHYSVLFFLPWVIKFCIQKCTWWIWYAVQFYAWAKLSLFPGRNGVRHLWSVVPMPQMSSNTKECKSQRVKGSQSSKVVRETDWTWGQKPQKGRLTLQSTLEARRMFLTHLREVKPRMRLWQKCGHWYLVCNLKYLCLLFWDYLMLCSYWHI